MSSQLERIPQQPPQILPLQKTDHRPLFSVMVPVYNCYQYIEQNLRSILQQDMGSDKMQIEVVDDGSTDGDVQALVQQIGNGRITYYRQPQNVGSLRNFETCINRAQGHLVHLFHGDDIVKNGFYAEIEQLYTEFPEIGAAFTGYHYINEKSEKIWNNTLIDAPRGIIDNFVIHIGKNQLLQTVSLVVKRSTYEKLGCFYGVTYGEDWEMWVRIAANFPVAHSPRVLTEYRVHNSNLTSVNHHSGRNIREIVQVINTFKQYLPPAQAETIAKIAKKNAAEQFARMAHTVWHHSYSVKGALAQTNGALSLHVGKNTLLSALKMYIKILISYKKK